jgi:hypothetical protein
MPWKSDLFCLTEDRVNCGNLLISVRMRAPFAPHMSFGSRATRRNLKRRHPIPSDELSRFVYFAGYRRCAQMRATGLVKFAGARE